jgi:hypothetical protein
MCTIKPKNLHKHNIAHMNLQRKGKGKKEMLGERRRAEHKKIGNDIHF